jgi:hypothetical protein
MSGLWRKPDDDVDAEWRCVKRGERPPDMDSVASDPVREWPRPCGFGVVERGSGVVVRLGVPPDATREGVGTRKDWPMSAAETPRDGVDVRWMGSSTITFVVAPCQLTMFASPELPLKVGESGEAGDTADLAPLVPLAG